MIHTVEFYFPLNRQSSRYCIGRLNQIARDYGAVNGRPRYLNDNLIRQFLNGDRRYLVFSMEYLVLGLHQIKFTKMPITDTSANYYIYFKIEPEVFITREYSLNLFQCNENNYDAFQSRFGGLLYQLFPITWEHRPIEGCNDLLSWEENEYRIHLDSGYYQRNLNREEWRHYIYRHLYSLPYLGLAKIARVDYTADFHCDHPDIYLRLAQQSYVDNARKKRKLYLEKGNYLAAYNRSVDGFLIYNKQKKYMLPRYDDKPNIDELRQAAANVMRIEYVFKSRNRREQLKFTKLNLPARGRIPYTVDASLCGLMPYIIQDIGEPKLRSEYYRLIGGGQWMTDYYWYDDTLVKADLTDKMKRKINKLGYLISDVRHLRKSKTAFVQGRDIQRYRGPGSLHVQGSEDTFRTYINTMRSLGLQPLRIPETRFFKPDGKQVTHVSSEYDSFDRVDLGVENHEVREWIGDDGYPIPVYESTVADLKALYNRYKPR